MGRTKANDHEENTYCSMPGRIDVKDGELKALIDNSLPTLHRHPDMVIEMKEKMR